MGDNANYSALIWLKGVLEETLTTAGKALELYVEESDEVSDLQKCADGIHQVYSALQIAEIYGAALVAEEVELVLHGLINNQISKRDEAIEVVTGAIIQLPEYLGRLESGQKDVPLAMLPLVNDLRAARSTNLVTEGALFSPNLNGIALTDDELSSATPNPQLPDIAKRLRHAYHKGLLGWFRDQNAQNSLELLKKVIGQLEESSSLKPVVQLWSIAKTLIDALSNDGVESSVAVKLLMGQLDRQLKRLIDNGELTLAEKPVLDLYKNLLYYVAGSTYSNDTSQAIRDQFELDAALPNDDELQSMQGAAGGMPNADIMKSVAGAIKEDLLSIKDKLDMFMRSSMDDATPLLELTDPLKKVGDTLGMLGQGMLRKKVIHQVSVLEMLKDHGGAVSEERIMEMAGDLLYIESAIDGLQAKRFDPVGTMLPGMSSQQDNDEEFVVPEGEYQDVLNVILQEMTNEISLCKESIVGFLDGQESASVLDKVLNSCRDISGAFYILQLKHSGVLVDAISDAIKQYIIDSTTQDEAILDHIANAVTGIEYYIEGVFNYRFSDMFMLSITQENLEAIGQTIKAFEQPVVTTAKPAPAPAEPVAAVEIIEPPAVEEPIEVAPVVEAESEPEVAPVAEPPKVEAPVAPVGSSVPGSGAPLLEEIDEEILEIFMEEAKEELENIQTHYPKWKNERDQESLSIIRRSFHTLKGSGRLVGAVTIGEFAWAVENMLNRVIDGTIDVGPQMFLILDDVVAALPELVHCQEVGTQPTVDVAGISARAEIVSKPGGEAELAATAPTEVVQKPVATPAETVAPPVEPEVEAHAVIEMDDVLYDIFTAETSTHLQAIQDFIELCEDSDGCQCDESLIRSVHTLHGSAHMANVTQIALVSASLEKLIKAMIKSQAEADKGFINLITDVVGVIKTYIASINNVSAEIPDHQEVIDRIESFKNQYNFEDVSEIVLTVDMSSKPEPEEAPQLQPEPDSVSTDDLVEQVEVSGPDELVPATVEESVDAAIIPVEPAVEAAADTTVDDSDDMDDELVEIFLEESSDIIDVMEQTVQQWTNSPADSGLIADLQRSLHTLKGGARLSGLGMIGDVSHSLESLLTGIGNRSVSIHDEIVNLVHRSVDELDKMLQVVKNQKVPEPASELLDLIDDALAGRLLESYVQQADDKDEDEADVDEANEISAPEAADAPTPEPQVAAKATESTSQRKAQEFVKIRSDLLDTLVNYAGEISIYRSRLEQQNGNFLFNLTELDQTVSRLRNQLRNLEIETEAQILFRYEKEQEEIAEAEEDDEEFDPLEMDRFSKMQQLSRSLLESVTDLMSIQEMMSNLARESETLLLQQARVNTELQEGLMRTRMVPFSSMVPKLNRLVRQTCKQLDKKAELEVIGAAGEMDRTIMERMMAPLEHMIRNAISHGIEDKSIRKSRLKPENGKITLQLTREGTDIVLYVADDGGGIGVDMVREKAIERGLIQPNQTELSEEDILQFILESGFSTASEISQISGRGVGMDVVNSEIKQLGGSLHIDSQKDHGTLFTVRLPFTLAINQALLVQITDETYAIPHSSIEGVVRLSRDELERCYSGEKTEYEYAGNHYHVQYIGALLGAGRAVLQEKKRWFPVLLVRTGQHRIALQVDAILGNREIVVKSVGPQVSSVNWVSGATIMGDGRVVLILDVSALVRHGSLQTAAPAAAIEEVVAEPQRSVPSVMVVDDSITVRKVTTRLLERHEMNVFTAKDGVDAIQVLQEQIPDIMLLDVEMPRMDGYELARHIRNSDRLKHIPIIMITSRTGEKHRQRAMEIGVNTYLGKPYQEAELLENIHALLDA